MAHRVTLIPGDGTGPELTEATRRVLEATRVEIAWEVQHAGVEGMESAGTPLPEETLASIKRNPGVRSRYTEVDLVLVRENTEDLYAGIEYESGSEDARAVISTLNRLQKRQIRASSGLSLKPIRPEASARLVRFALHFART